MPDFLTRIGHDLAGDFRALTLTGLRANAAFRSALTTVLAALIAMALNLDNPWWAGISGVVLVQTERTATLARSVDRVIGTMTGAAIGYAAAGLADDHLAFLAIIGGCTGFALYAQERAQHGYAFLLGGITVVLVTFGSLAEPGKALNLSIYRGLEIIVGVVTACAVDYALAEAGETPVGAARLPGVFTRPIDRELAAIAIAGAVTIMLIPVVWEALDLPGLGQTPITAVVILVAMRQEPGWRAFTRFVGCLSGAVWGLLAMHFVGDAFLPWLLTLFVGLYLAAHINMGKGDAAYVGMQGGIAIVVTMIQGAGPSPDLAAAFSRLVGVFGGVVFVALCQPILTPLVRFIIKPRS